MSTLTPEQMATFAEVGKDLYSLGFVSSHGGNLSVRVGHEVWITGTGTMLGRLRDRHMSLVLPDGKHTGPPPSSDTLLHSAIYALGGAQAVVHAHPHHAIAMTFETELFVPPDFEGQHFLKDVPVIQQGLNQVAALATALQSRLVVMLEGHGAYARGQSLWEALHWITALEESAHISWLRR
jgi:L-fuculose-phosphate aldolase